MLCKQYIINFGKKIGLQVVLFGNGFMLMKELVAKTTIDLHLKINPQKLYYINYINNKYFIKHDKSPVIKEKRDLILFLKLKNKTP